MKKLLIALVLLLSSSSFAADNAGVCSFQDLTCGVNAQVLALPSAIKCIGLSITDTANIYSWCIDSFANTYQAHYNHFLGGSNTYYSDLLVPANIILLTGGYLHWKSATGVGNVQLEITK